MFTLFVAGPTLVACIDKDADISFAFTANEEENSAKNLLNLEFIKDEQANHHEAYLYLREESSAKFYYAEDHHQVYLDVLSPPPRHI